MLNKSAFTPAGDDVRAHQFTIMKEKASTHYEQSI